MNYFELQQKYPDRIPVILSTTNSRLPPLPKTQFLVPMDYTLADFHMLIRKSLKMNSSDALFFFIWNTNILPLNSQTMKELYHEHHQKGVLKFQYEQEEVFGCNDWRILSNRGEEGQGSNCSNNHLF